MMTRRSFLKGLAGVGILASGGGPLLLPSDHIAAHEHCSNHRDALKNSSRCGCFCCLSTFSSSEATVWLDEENGRPGPTALCPNCGVDAVIGDRSGYPVTKEFLAKMERYWFGLL